MATKDSNEFLNDLIRGGRSGSSVAESEDFQAMWVKMQEALMDVVEAAEQLNHSVEALPESEGKRVVQDHLEDLSDLLSDTGPVVTAVDDVETALGIEDDLFEPASEDDDPEEEEDR